MWASKPDFRGSSHKSRCIEASIILLFHKFIFKSSSVAFIICPLRLVLSQTICFDIQIFLTTSSVTKLKEKEDSALNNKAPWRASFSNNGICFVVSHDWFPCLSATRNLMGEEHGASLLEAINAVSFPYLVRFRWALLLLAERWWFAVGYFGFLIKVYGI